MSITAIYISLPQLALPGEKVKIEIENLMQEFFYEVIDRDPSRDSLAVLVIVIRPVGLPYKS